MEKKNKLIYQLKGIAIFCVISAHCGNRVSLSTMDTIMNQIRGNISYIGVPIFFIISGYLYNNEKGFMEFWKKKCYTTIIPWIFWGTLVWGYEVIRKGLSYAKLSEWLLGIGNYLWFMRTIVIFWLLMYFCKGLKARITMFAIACICRIVLYDVLKVTLSSTILECIILHIPFFSFGMLLKNLDVSKIQNKYCCMLMIFPFCIALPLMINKHEIGYSSPGFLVYIIGCLFGIMYFIVKRDKYQKFILELEYLGENSFAIYLMHMPIAGLLSNLFSRREILLYLVLLQPIIVSYILIISIGLIKKICMRYKWLSLLTGISV